MTMACAVEASWSWFRVELHFVLKNALFVAWDHIKASLAVY